MTIRRWGTETLVNTTTVGSQKTPEVAALANGNYVITWNGATNLIEAQLFRADGTRFGGAAEANFDAYAPAFSFTGSQSAQVAGLADNSFVLTSVSSQGDVLGIQRFDAANWTIAFADFSATINPFPTPSEVGVDSDIARFSNSGWVTAYTVFRDPATEQYRVEVRGRESPASAPFAFSVSINAIDAEIASTPNGSRYAVAFNNAEFGGISVAIGNQSGIAVPIGITGDNGAKDVFWIDNQTFGVVWVRTIDAISGGGDGSSSSIFLRLYNHDGINATPITSEIRVNSTAFGEQNAPSVAVLADGSFAVVWTDFSGIGGDASGASIKFQAFDSSGAKLGREVLVNSTTLGNQMSPKIAALPDGRLVVTWQDASATGGDTSFSAIRSQIMDIRDGYVVGGDGNDTLFGNDSADDQVFAGGGNDMLRGLAGNDFLDGGLGNDTMSGGRGDDDYVVDSIGDITTERANEGVDTLNSSVTRTLSANIENLTLISGAGNINGTGNVLNNALTGNEGNNALNGGLGDDEMYGLDGNDTYTVDSAGDAVFENLNEGLDTVLALVTYVIGANLERLTLLGSNAIDGTGNELANTITGNDATNFLFGLNGDDTLSGGLGVDVMNGGAGNDTYSVDSFFDSIVEAPNQGTDRVNSSVTFALPTNVENLTLVGTTSLNGTGNDTANIVTGNSNSNLLDGLDGADTLSGGAGLDILFGGLGNDRLAGGTEADVFSFLDLAGGVDTILDFVLNVDDIRIDASGFGGGLNAALGLSAAQFVAGPAATGAAPAPTQAFGQFLYNTTTGALFFDSNGTGATGLTQIAIMNGRPALTFTDFQLVP
jgi:Ca2+-binding RTX toxin-like protein